MAILHTTEVTRYKIVEAPHLPLAAPDCDHTTGQLSSHHGSHKGVAATDPLKVQALLFCLQVPHPLPIGQAVSFHHLAVMCIYTKDVLVVAENGFNIVLHCAQSNSLMIGGRPHINQLLLQPLAHPLVAP